MSDSDDVRDFVHRPHDALFQRMMSDAYAVRELVELLPEELSERIDLDSVKPTDTHFVDDRLRHLYSDCLLEARLSSGESMALYYLVEHLSSPDRTIAFRVLQYTVSHWDRILRTNEGKGKLPLVIPILIYNGKGRYPHSLELRDMIDAPADLVEKFLFRAPTLIALREIPDARLAQKVHLGAALMAMKHAYDEIPAEVIFQMLALIEDHKRRLGFTVSLFSYIISIDSKVNPMTLVDLVGKYLGQEAKEGSMTVAQQLIEKGRNEGLEKGREEAAVAIAKKLLASGFDLEMVRENVSLPLEDLMLLRDELLP